MYATLAVPWPAERLALMALTVVSQTSLDAA